MRRIILVMGLGLTACTNTSNLPPAPAVPNPIRADSLPPYYIQVGDVLDVRLMLNPELNEEVTVRPDGGISTTVVPNERAAGRTIPELDAALHADYSHDLQNPRISVLVRTFAPSRVYVGGEVVTPNEFITTGPISLAQVIARAGGLKFSADTPDIFIIRHVGNTAAPEFLSVRYNDVIHAKDAAADIMLAPYDVVYVPKTGIAEVYKWYNQYIEEFAHPSVGFNYLLNGAGAVINGGNTTTPTH